jgi:gliding motility-associated-like protein
MKQIVLLLLVVYTHILAGQNRQKHWYFGPNYGLQFNNGAPTVLPFNTKKEPLPLGYATMSDDVTGDFLFLAHGGSVYDKNFDLMPGGETISYVWRTIIVPIPANDKKYLIFYHQQNNAIVYAEVDMTLRGGLGDVTYVGKLLANNTYFDFTVVRQGAWGNGYWLVTHAMGNNEYKSFVINYNGIVSGSGVSSFVGKPINDNPYMLQWGNITSNKTGTLITHTYLESNLGNEITADILSFDRCTGKLSLLHTLPTIDNDNNYPYRQVRFAFSANDKYLYALSIVAANPNKTYDVSRYDITAANPAATKTIVYTETNKQFSVYDIALLPDDKIYTVGTEGKKKTLNAVNAPESSNPVYARDAFAFFPDTTTNIPFMFPVFIMDTLVNDAPKTSHTKELCSPDSVSFSAVGYSIFDTAYWSFGDGTYSAVLNTKHLYKDTGEYITTFTWSMCGASSTTFDTVKVFIPPTIQLGPDTLLCNGVKYPLTVKGGNEYQWSSAEKTATIVVEKAGTYWVKAKRGNCVNTDTVTINYNPSIWVQLGGNYYLCEDDNQTVKLDAGKGFNEYMWTPTGDTTQRIIVKKAGDYYVVVKDLLGCSGGDGTIVERRCDLYAEIPNAFTPNGDGLNDVFLPFVQEVKQYQLTIYNRWGEQVFASQNPAQGWDGTYNNTLAPVGVYSYTLSYSGFLSQISRKYNKQGTLHLMR